MGTSQFRLAIVIVLFAAPLRAEESRWPIDRAAPPFPRPTCIRLMRCAMPRPRSARCGRLLPVFRHDPDLSKTTGRSPRRRWK